MSQQIDNQIVKMQFDNASFEKNAQQSMSTLDKLKHALKFDKVNMTPLQEAFSETEATATKAGFNIRDVWLKMSSIIEQEIAQKVVDAGKKMLNALSFEGINDGFKEYELKMGSIQTIMAGTGESLATVNRYLDDLNKYSDQTIYSFSDMTQNIGKFTNAGVKLRDAVDAIKGIANEAAVSGANANEASRAMYNFAQALSAGYVKLIDWKSIENANMATKEFKETLLDIAVAMGNATKTSDGMYKILTTNNKGKTMDELVSGTKNFNDSLQYQWMTTEVLTKALKLYATNVESLSEEERKLYEQELKNMGLDDKQIEKFEQLGIKATKAASEIKTFSMLMDTLKEAIGSGWAMTWQLIIGDFEQAKALWTEVGNTMSSVIDGMSDARNKFLKAGLQTGWEEFTTMEGKAIPQAEKFREVLVDLARDQGKLTKEQYIGINSTETFMKSLHQYGWLTGGLLSEAVDDYTKMLESMSDAEIDEFGIKPSDVEQMKKLNAELKAGTINADEFAKKMINLGGRENLIQGLRNIFEGLKSIIKPIGEAFDNIFGVMDPQKLYQFTENFKNFTAQLKLSDDAALGLRSSFTLAFGAIKFVFDTIGTTLKGVSKLVLPVLNIFDALVGVVGSVFRAFSSITHAISGFRSETSLSDRIADGYLGTMDTIATVLNKVADVIRNLTGYATSFGFKLGRAFASIKDEAADFYKQFKEMPIIKRMVDDFNNSVAKIEAKIRPIGKTVRDTLAGMKVDVKSTFSFETLNKVLTTVYDKLNKVFKVVKDFGGRLKEFFKDLKNGKSVVESFRENFGDIIDKIKELKENVVGFFEDLFSKAGEMDGKFNLKAIQQAIHDFVTNIKPEQVTMIAVAGTFLIIALNLIKLSNALKDAVDTFTGIGVAFKNVINSYIKKQKSAILQVAEAIVIVAASLWVLSTIPKDKLDNAVQALMSIGAVLGILTLLLTACGAALSLMGGKAKMVELATGLVLVSGAFMMSALTLKVLEDVDLKGILPKLITMAAVMYGLVAISTIMGFLNKGFSKGALTMVAVAGALYIAANALSEIASIPEESMESAMNTLFKMMVGLAAVVFASSKVGIFSAVGLIAIVLTLDKLLPAIEKIVNYDYSNIEKGLDQNANMLKKMGGLMLILTGIGMLAGNRIKGAAIAMLAIAGTFAILVGVAKLAAQLKPQELKKGEQFLWSMAGIIALIELCSSKSRLGMFGGKDSEGSKVFTRIAFTMGILLGIAKLASMMSWRDLAKGEVALAGLLAMVGLMTLVAKNATNSQGTLKAVAGMLVGISAVLVMVAVLSMIPLKSMAPALAAVLSILLTMSLLATAIAKMNGMPGTKPNVMGLVAMVASLVAVCVIAGFLVALSKQPMGNVATAAGSMIGIIVAIAALAKAMSGFEGKISTKSILAVGEMLVLVAAMAAILFTLSAFIDKYNINPNTMLSAAGAISIALLGLVPVLLVLNKFGSYTGNRANGGNYKKMITAVGGAIAALVAVAAAIGLLSRFGGDGDTMIKSAVALAIGMIAICAPIAILGAVGKFVKGVKVGSMITIILGALAALGGVTAALIVMSNTANPDNLLLSAKTLAMGLVAICIPIAVLGVVGQFCAAANPGVMLVALGGAIVAMAAVSEILLDFAGRINPVMLNTLNSAMPALITAISGVALLAVAISVAGLLAGPGGFAAVAAGGLAMVEAIGVLILIVGAIALLGAALNKWEGLKKALETGLDYLVIIAGKIGEAIGAFIGGIGVGLTSQMIKMAENLTEFSEKLIPFSENMKKISSDVVDGCKNLASAILYITAAEFLDGLSKWLGLGTSNLDFESLGTAVVAFANEVAGLSEDAVNKAKICSDIALILSQVAGNLDREGGWVQAIIGQKDLGKFSENIAMFGRAIKDFAISVTGLAADSIELAQRAADTAEPMVELSKTLTGTGGWVQKVIGEKDLGQFGSNLADFAEGLIKFISKLCRIENFAADYPERVQKCADAMTPMVDLASGIENAGGYLAAWVGENTLDVFGETLAPFGDGMIAFVQKLVTLDSTASNYPQLIDKCVTATKKLVELANSLENMGGAASWFVGDNTLKKFGKTLEPFGESLSVYSGWLKDVDFVQINNVNSSVQKLVELGSFASGIGSDAFNGLTLSLQQLSQLPIATLTNEVNSNTPLLVNAYNTMFKNLVTIVTNRKTTDGVAYTSYGTALVDAIKNGINRQTAFVMIAVTTLCNGIKTRLGLNMPASAFNVYGTNVTSGIASGIYSGSGSVIAAARATANVIGSTLLSLTQNDQTYNNYDKAYEAGKYVAEGLANGIKDHTDLAVNAAKRMADKVNEALPKQLGERSPSKIAYRFGMYYDQGLANGITDYAGVAITSTQDMADDIITTANTIVNAIAAAMDANIDNSPVIRPVLDTSDLEYKASNIGRMFDDNDLALAYSTSAHMKAIAPSGESMVADEEADSVVAPGASINFTQNNYSPKALNRYEIYRNTKNQISQLKGALV